MDTRVTSNQRVTVWIGPAAGIADYNKPTLAEVAALTNVSGAVNWNSFDFNLSASDSADDRTLTDAAGAKSRSFDQFGGSIEFVKPKPTDTSSIYYTAYQILKGDRTKLAVVIRTVTTNSTAVAAGDVVNAYRVLADAQALVRGDSSYAYKVNFLPQDDVGVNAIIPSGTATAVTLTPAATATCTIDGTVFFKATYEGNNVTIGATYTSSDPAVLQVTPHGIGIGISAGTSSVTATYPGSAAGAATVVTVS